MGHEYYRGVYARTPAWHRLGTVWPDLLTTEEAIRESGVDFNVEKTTLYVEREGIFLPVDGWKAIYGDNGFGVVGIHSDEYEPDRYADHFRALGFGPDEKVWECMVLLRKGRIATGAIRLPDLDTILPDGSKYMACVNAYSSHDGTYAISYKDSAWRWECANMLRAGDASNEGRVFRIRHTANKDNERRNAALVMTYAQERADFHARQCEELLKKKISDQQLDKLLNQIWPVPEELGRGRTIAQNKQDTVRGIYRSAPDLSGLRGTAWGVVQAFGQFADHEATYRGTDKDDRERSRNESRFIRTVLKGDTVADKVYQLVEAL